jgi:hypothetical protein
MTALTLALALAGPAMIASLTLAWAIEAWRLGAPFIAAGFAATGAGIAYATVNAILN